MATTLTQDESVRQSVGENDVGKVVVEIELVNAVDEANLLQGNLSPGKVRKVRIQAIVDTGSTALSVPEDLIKKLGLPVLSQVISKYADGRREPRNVYGPALIRLMNRQEVVSVLSGHPAQPALLGQIPLEGLDLLVDCKRQRLIVNPESPDMPMRIT